MNTSNPKPHPSATANAVAHPPPNSAATVKRFPNADALLSKRDVLAQLGIGEKTLRRLIQQGRLAVVKFGKTSPLKFRQLDVARLLESAVATASINSSRI